MTVLHVAGASPYDVAIGRGVLDQIPLMLGSTPQRVALIHAEALTEITDRVTDLLTDYDVVRIGLPEGEAAKTAGVAGAAWETLGGHGFTRSDAVVSLGGGATTDMAGFIAATWLRGVRIVHVPTTLLAMVDAAVGGKTGMNTGAGKNLVGSFHEPAGVVCDLDLLSTLPKAELVAGMGEVIKCGFIADPVILDLIERDPMAALDPQGAVLSELVQRSIKVKIDVVVADLKETGGAAGHPGREVLNYGHTLAHAIEKLTDYSVRHGEAVAIGCCFAAELARRTGHLDNATADRHRVVLASVGLPVTVPPLPGGFDAVKVVMAVDKKSRGATLRFLILEALGRPAILSGPPEESLRAAYQAVGGTP